MINKEYLQIGDIDQLAILVFGLHYYGRRPATLQVILVVHNVTLLRIKVGLRL